MSSRRYLNASLITVSAYAAIGMLAWVVIDSAVPEQAPKDEVIRIDVIPPPSEPEPTPQPIPTPVPIPEPGPEPIQEVIPEPEPIAEPIPKPVPEPVILPKPKPFVQPQSHKMSPKILHPKSKKNRNPSSKTASAKPASQKNEQLFLGRVRAKIQANKVYPKIAIQKHIEGVVHATFDIQKNGVITNIRLGGAPMVLQKAVKQTLERCSPVAVDASAAGKLPMYGITVSLDFRLR
jgi:outer membrane biosynthesis protein TonB